MSYPVDDHGVPRLTAQAIESKAEQVLRYFQSEALERPRPTLIADFVKREVEKRRLQFDNSKDLGCAPDGGRIIGTEFATRADFAAMARAFSAEGITVTRHEEIRDAVGHALSCGKPCVIDMIIASDPIPPPVAGDWCEPERAWVEPLPRKK